jgi:hypothetical protein
MRQRRQAAKLFSSEPTTSTAYFRAVKLSQRASRVIAGAAGQRGVAVKLSQ